MFCPIPEVNPSFSPRGIFIAALYSWCLFYLATVSTSFVSQTSLHLRSFFPSLPNWAHQQSSCSENLLVPSSLRFSLSVTGCRFLGRQSFSFDPLKIPVHCLLSSIIAVENNSELFVKGQPNCQAFKGNIFLKLQLLLRFFSLPLFLCNFTIMDLVADSFSSFLSSRFIEM